MKRRPVIRPATRADIEKFYGKPPEHTQRAIVGLVNGRILGCGGVAYIDGHCWAFCDLKPSAKKYQVSLYKACIEILDKAKSAGARTIFAKPDTKEPSTTRFLLHLGFQPIGGGIWQWQD